MCNIWHLNNSFLSAGKKPDNVIILWSVLSDNPPSFPPAWVYKTSAIVFASVPPYLTAAKGFLAFISSFNFSFPSSEERTDFLYFGSEIFFFIIHFLDIKNFKLINDYYGSEDVERIIIDVKNSCDRSKVTNEKVVGCITDIIDDSVFNTSMVKVPSYLSESKKIGDIIDISKYL